jgi:four helix bundle protein
MKQQTRSGEEVNKGFEDLKAWQLARCLMIDCHEVANTLPPIERYDLAPQIRRSSKSVMANIAEGYGRYHYLDSLRFYYVARGSLNEVLSGLIACDEVGYTSGQLANHRELCHSALRSLNGYIRYVRKQQQGIQEYGDRALHEYDTLYVTQSQLPDED